MDLFARAEPEMRWASQPRMQLEMAAVRACRPAFDESVQALTERLDALERKLASGAYAVPAGQSAPAGQAAPAARRAAPAAAPAARRSAPEGDAAIWQEVRKAVTSTRMQLFTALKMGSFLGMEGDEAVVSFEAQNDIFHGICIKEEHHALIDEAFSKVCGRPVRARFVLAAQPQSEPKSPVDEGALFAAFGRENVDIVD